MFLMKGFPSQFYSGMKVKRSVKHKWTRIKTKGLLTALNALLCIAILQDLCIAILQEICGI